MNRIFLAFMALLAGLAAQVSPAATRVSEDTQIGAAADAQQLERQAAVLASVAEARPAEAYAPVPNRAAPALEARASVRVAVLIGIDRARE